MLKIQAKLQRLLDEADVPISEKSAAWRQFWTSQTQAEFESGIRSLFFSQETKRALWDLRFPSRPEIEQIWKDAEFYSLPSEERKSRMEMLDPDFAALPRKAKEKIVRTAEWDFKNTTPVVESESTAPIDPPDPLDGAVNREGIDLGVGSFPPTNFSSEKLSATSPPPFPSTAPPPIRVKFPQGDRPEDSSGFSSEAAQDKPASKSSTPPQKAPEVKPDHEEAAPPTSAAGRQGDAIDAAATPTEPKERTGNPAATELRPESGGEEIPGQQEGEGDPEADADKRQEGLKS